MSSRHRWCPPPDELLCELELLELCEPELPELRDPELLELLELPELREPRERDGVLVECDDEGGGDVLAGGELRAGGWYVRTGGELRTGGW